MRSALQSVFGSYVPNTYTDELGNVIPLDGLAGLDWEYILGVLIFTVLLVSALGIIRTVVKNHG